MEKKNTYKNPLFWRYAFILIATLLMTGWAHAQPGPGRGGGFSHHNRQGMEKIESAKIALITKRLDLSPSQAEKFWPVYNAFSKQRKELHHEFLELRKKSELDGLSDKESQKLVEESMAIRERELKLEKSYKDKFLEVISPQQLLELHQAEEDFRRMLLHRLEKRRHGEGERMRNGQQGY